MPPKKAEKAEPEFAGGEEGKKLWEHGLRRGQFTTMQDLEELERCPVPESLQAHDGANIVRKSVDRAQQVLVSLPGHLESLARSSSGVDLGAIKDLDSPCPILYLDFAQGRLKLRGSYVYPKTPLMALQYRAGLKPKPKAQATPKGKKPSELPTVDCRSIFKSVLVFSDWSWIGTKEENPDELALPLPPELSLAPPAEAKVSKGGASKTAATPARTPSSRAKNPFSLASSQNSEMEDEDLEPEEDYENEDEEDEDEEDVEGEFATQKDEDDEDSDNSPLSSQGKAKRKAPATPRAKSSAAASSSSVRTPAKKTPAPQKRRRTVVLDSDEEDDDDEEGSEAEPADSQEPTMTPSRQSSRRVSRVNYKEKFDLESSEEEEDNNRGSDEEEESEEEQPRKKQKPAPKPRTPLVPKKKKEKDPFDPESEEEDSEEESEAEPEDDESDYED